MYHWTSDLHFGHKNITKYNPATRPFATVEDMDEAIIASWNSRVAPTDTTYLLGDLTFYRDLDKVMGLVDRLNGEIVYVGGNHDEIVWKNRQAFSRRFLAIKDYLETRVEGQKIIMCHFAFRVWNQQHRGSWNLYGHSHGSLTAVGKQMDVGWDTNDLGPDWLPGPISFPTIKAVMDSRPIEVHDHHVTRPGEVTPSLYGHKA